MMSGSLSDMQHADPATARDGDLDDLRLFSPRELYFLWERSHWAAGELDFERDRSEWAELPGDQRALLLRSIAPFFVGEERIAHAFAPILLAAEDEQETAFLATQQVDEARHMQFFDGFWRAVASHDASSSRALDDARARCNDAFTELFDRRLMQAVDRLRLDPRDSDAKVQAVGIYHLLVEGTLALTGMHFLLDYVERHAILPGFTAGMRNVKHDEHRHVAWGTWFLRRKCRAEERAGRIVAETLMELLPIAASVLLEEGSAACDGLDDCAFLDYPSAELNHLGLLSLARRLKVIGGATAEVQQFAASGAWRAARVL
jgi:ribonucleoside-diphosphate reductase beta chain